MISFLDFQRIYKETFGINTPLDKAIVEGDVAMIKKLAKENKLPKFDENKLNFIYFFGDYDVALTLMKLRQYTISGALYLIKRSVDRDSYDDIIDIINTFPAFVFIPITYTINLNSSPTVEAFTLEQIIKISNVLKASHRFSRLFEELAISVLQHYGIEKFITLLENVPLNEHNKFELLSTLVIGKINCDNLDRIINTLELPLEETKSTLQGHQPSPICTEYPTYKSKRGKILSYQLPALGLVPPTKIEPKYKILSNFRTDEDCFCLQVIPGIYDDVYLPVIRYGRSSNLGFYGGRRPNTEKIDFTWYYIEPESGIYLHCPRLLVTKNKVAAAFRLSLMALEDDPNVLEETFTIVKQQLRMEEDLKDMNAVTFARIILDPKPIMITPTFDNYFNVKGDDDLGRFEAGAFDFIDPFVTNVARNKDIQVIAFTHERGYRRMVSECVDNRLREESYRALYKIT